MLGLFKLAAECGVRAGFFPGLYDGVCQNGQVTLDNGQEIFILLANVIRILVAMAGALAVIFIIVGGIFYVISMGDPARIKRAKEIITQAITGLVVIILSYALVTWIVNQFAQKG